MDDKCAKCGNPLPEGTTRCVKCNPLSMADAPLLRMGCLKWTGGSALIAWLVLQGFVLAFHFGGLSADLLMAVLGVLALTKGVQL